MPKETIQNNLKKKRMMAMGNVPSVENLVLYPWHWHDIPGMNELYEI
jgi:hypothetical protein